MKNKRILGSFTLIIVVGFLAYGFVIPFLGIYFDDWLVILAGHYEQSSIFVSFFPDRPNSGIVFSILHSIIGNTPLHWHIWSLCLRIFGSLALWWGLSVIWKQQNVTTLTICLLYLLFPGLSFQTSPLMYWAWLFSLSLGVYSLSATINAYYADSRRRKFTLTFLAVISGTISTLGLEIFIFQEAIRLCILFILSHPPTKWDFVNRAQISLKYSCIHLLTSVPFITWRLFIFSSPRTTTDVSLVIERSLSDPLRTTIRLPFLAILDGLETGILGWFVPAHYRIWQTVSEYQAIYLVIALLVFIAFIVCFRFIAYNESRLSVDTDNQDIHVGTTLMFCGLVATLIGVGAMNVVGGNIQLLTEFNRSTTIASLGSSLLIVSIVVILVKNQWQLYIFAFLIALAFGTQIANGHAYVEANHRQRNMWWQLSWRVPDLKPSTTIIVNIPVQRGIPYRDSRAQYMQIDDEILGAVNLLYSYDNSQPDLNGGLWNERLFTTFDAGLDYTFDYRYFKGRASASSSLLLYMPDNGECLKIIDPDRISETYLSEVKLQAHYSNLDSILLENDPHIPQSSIFGSEPFHDWCYYYQKANLALHAHNYESILQIYLVVEDLNFVPQTSVEWYPYIEGMMYLDQREEAQQLIQKVIAEDLLLIQDICQIIYRLEKLDQYTDLPC